MKRIIFSLFLLTTMLACFTGCGNNNNNQPGMEDSDIPKTSDSIIKAEVMLVGDVEDITLPPYCGRTLSEMSLKYKITKLISGKYDGSKILIHHICVREAVEDKQIQDNVKYTFTLKRRKMGLVGNVYIKVNDFDIVQ